MDGDQPKYRQSEASLSISYARTVLLAVLSGRYAHKLFEDSAEVKGIGISRQHTNFSDTEFSGGQKHGAVVYPQHLLIGMGRLSGFLFEQIQKAALTQTTGVSQFFDTYVHVIMSSEEGYDFFDFMIGGTDIIYSSSQGIQKG